MDSLDLAYIAGFFDGEGDCAIRLKKAPNNKYYPRLEVRLTQNDRIVLDWIKKEFGGSVYEKPDNRTINLNHAWMTSHQKARRFLTEIEPFLRIKRDKVSKLLDSVGRTTS